jgi:hypothetical protein
MEATALEFLKIQVDFNNDVISKNIAGISNEEAMIFPDNNANPANWILGHLIFIRNAMIQVLGGDKVWEAVFITTSRDRCFIVNTWYENQSLPHSLKPST